MTPSIISSLSFRPTRVSSSYLAAPTPFTNPTPYAFDTATPWYLDIHCLPFRRSIRTLSSPPVQFSAVRGSVKEDAAPARNSEDTFCGLTATHEASLLVGSPRGFGTQAASRPGFGGPVPRLYPVLGTARI